MKGGPGQLVVGNCFHLRAASPRPPPVPLERSLRIAILLNPFDLAVKGGEYAPQLARELLGRGHHVRGFGAPSGVIPRSGAELDPSGQATKLEFPGVVGFRPDVVIAYDALSPAAFLGARAAGKLGVPLVLVEAGTSTGGRWHERALRWCGERLWGRYVRKRVSQVIALDPVARAQALDEGFADSKVRVLPQGVDLASFRPGLTSHLVRHHRILGRVLLYVGRVTPDRGLEVLIHAFARTLGQGRDWSLVIAGEGPSSARQSLLALVNRQGISASVHWLPAPRAEELPGLLGSASLLAVPATDDGVRGVQIPRAMACGLPVLASRMPRFEGLVEDEGCGLLVDAGDVVAWTDALRRASSAPESRKRWGLRGRQLAEERLGWAVVAREVEALLIGAVDGVTEAGSADSPESDARRA